MLTLTVLAATVALITQGFISYKNPVLAETVNLYGTVVSSMVHLEVIHPGTIRSDFVTEDDVEQISAGDWAGLSWRELPDYEGEPGTFAVVAVTPDASGYSQVIDDCLAKDVNMVVESSGMDAWHTTEDGLTGLKNLTSKALRVVIFDGGHHLPTLGLKPDLLIVPVTRGYVAHGHTRDAMKIEELLTILRREEIGCPVVAVPRWGLVKTPASMNRIAVKALTQIPLGEPVPGYEGKILGSRCTVRKGAFFWFVSHIDSLNPEWLDSGGVEAKRIYIAFNYNSVNPNMARKFVTGLRRSGLQVIIVNEPVDVMGVIFRGV